MRFSLTRLTNTALLIILGVLLVTGVYGLFWTLNGWIWDVHRYAGWLLVAALPWKSAIVVRSLRNKWRPGAKHPPSVWVSLFLATVTLAVAALGILWNWRLGPDEYPLRQTAIAWHWILGIGLAAPLAVHVLQRWVKPKQVDFLSRRAFLRWGVLTIGGLAAWQAAAEIARLRQTGTPINTTGSRLAAIHSGNNYPVTDSLPARSDQVQLDTWRFTLTGAVGQPRQWSYAELLKLPDSKIETRLDCTLGWYTVQEWSGPSLANLLDQSHVAGGSGPHLVRLRSVTGYEKDLPMEEARQIVLATHVGGEPLSLEHGFPLRAVVPTRRGWYWVKWLAEIEVLTGSPGGG